MEILDKARLLIVDDEEGMRDTLFDILTDRGYEVETAASGVEGVEKARNGSFNVVLLDIRLPDWLGTEVLREIKKASPRVEVIMMTAYASLETSIQALNQGAYAYVLKPLSVEELLVTIERALEKQQLATENARLLVKLQDAYQALKEMDKMKSEFIAIAGHELRTPLSIILGYATLLQEDADGATAEQLGIVVNSAVRLRSLLDDMFSLRHVETGEAELELKEFFLDESLDEVVQELLPLASGKDQDIAIQLARRPFPIKADREKLYLVLAHLLSNAIKFTPEGGKITVSAEPFMENGRAYVQCSVADTGLGIPPEEMERIFRRFYQVEDSLTRIHGGMGLGLSVVKSMVELHGGRVWVESEVGKGSTFSFILPQ